MFDVFIHNPIALYLASGLIFIFASFLAFYSIKWYELAIFLAVFSPWVSIIFTPNTAELLYSERSASTGSYLRISILLLVGIVGIISFFKFRHQHKKAIPLQYILLGFFSLMALASTLYSLDQRMTLIRSVSFLLFFFFLLGLSSWIDNDLKIQKALNVISWVLTFFILANLLAIPLFPQKVWFLGKARFQGLWGHPNSLGSLCMISYPILIWKYFDIGSRGKWKVFLLIILTLAMHLLTGSRTTLVSSAFGIFIWSFLSKNKFSILFSVILVSLLAISLFLYTPKNLSRGENRSLSYLSDRQRFWSASMRLSLERPLLGYGYGVEGKVFDDPRFYEKDEFLWTGSSRASLHNGYFSTAIGVGFVGFAIFFLLLLLPFIKSFKILDNELKALMISTLIMCLLANFFESYITGPSNIGALLLWIWWVIAGQKAQIGNVTDLSLPES